ncbi:MAG: response regulator transcription factor [Bacteroidetes bacterium]|nr:response regulator transcription factor [Bacteroidota bacterium]
MQSIRLLLADSQYLIRLGLKSLLARNKHIKIVGESSNTEELLKKVHDLQPDVVLMDYKNSHHFNLEDIKEVKTISPSSKMLIISSDDDKNNIFKVIEYGINSFLTKECSEEEIMNAIVATAKNEKFFCNKILDIILAKHLSKEDDDCAPTELTVRELEIVGLIAEGHSTKDIAEELCLSTHTVYTHRKNVMRKLNVNSASELILYAINTGLVRTS